MRPARVLNVMTADEAKKVGITDNRKRYFRVADGKNNLSLAADKVDWFRSATVELGNGGARDGGDQVGVVDAVAMARSDGWGGRGKTSTRAAATSGGLSGREQPGQQLGRLRHRPGARAWRHHQKGPDRTKALGLANIWLAMGALVVVRKEDPARREVKEYVEVPPDPEEE